MLGLYNSFFPPVVGNLAQYSYDCPVPCAVPVHGMDSASSSLPLWAFAIRSENVGQVATSTGASLAQNASPMAGSAVTSVSWSLACHGNSNERHTWKALGVSPGSAVFAVALCWLSGTQVFWDNHKHIHL